MAVRRTSIDMNRVWFWTVAGVGQHKNMSECQSVHTTYGSDGYGGLSKGSRRLTKGRKMGGSKETRPARKDGNLKYKTRGQVLAVSAEPEAF